MVLPARHRVGGVRHHQQRPDQEKAAANRRERDIAERHQAAGTLAEPGQDNPEEPLGRHHDQGQEDPVEKAPAEVVGRSRRPQDQRQQDQPGEQEHVAAGAPPEHPRQRERRQQELRGEGEEEAQQVRREVVAPLAAPARHLGIVELNIGVEDIGRHHPEGERDGRIAARADPPVENGHHDRAADQDRHLGVDRRLAQPGQAGHQAELQTPPLRRAKRQHGAHRLEGGGPGEMRQREDRVEGRQLRHPPVERVGLLAEEKRLADRLHHVARAQAEREEAESPAARRRVDDEVLDEHPAGVEKEHRAADPGEVEGEQQVQVKQCREVPEHDPVDEEIDGGAGFGGVAVGPGPAAVHAFSHLGQVGVGVVAEEEEAHEGPARRLEEVGVEIGQQGDPGHDQAEDEPERRPPGGGRGRSEGRCPNRHGRPGAGSRSGSR